MMANRFFTLCLFSVILICRAGALTIDDNRTDSIIEKDSLGRVVKKDIMPNISIKYDAATGQITHGTKTVHNYDSLKRENIGISYNWDKSSNNWIVAGTDTSTYDENGNVVLDCRYVIDKEMKKRVTYKAERLYDKNSYLLSKTTYTDFQNNSKSKEPPVLSKQTKAYNKEGRLSNEAYYKYDSDAGKWVEHTRLEYIYDCDGRTTEYTYTTKKNEPLSLSKIKVTTPTDTGRGTNETSYKWLPAPQKWVGDSRDEYLFDKQGKILSKVTYHWKGDSAKWMLFAKKEDAYDSLGRRTSQTECKNYNNQGTYTESTTKDSYNPNGTLQSTTMSRLDNNDTTRCLIYSDEYTYDENKRLKTKKELDYCKNKVTGGKKLEYEYDKQRNSTKTYFYGWDDSMKTVDAWILQRTEEDTFDSKKRTIAHTWNIWSKSHHSIMDRGKIEYAYNDLDTCKTIKTITQYGWDNLEKVLKINSITELASTKQQIHFTPATDSLYLSWEAGEQCINIRSNRPWTVSTSCDWIKIITTSGNGNGKLKFRIRRNETPYLLRGKIIVFFGDVTGRRYNMDIKVYQAPAQP